MDKSEARARLDVLLRICNRGQEYFLRRKDSSGIDLFDHMRTELKYFEEVLQLDKVIQ